MTSKTDMNQTRRILVVDDDAPLLDAIERALSEAGEQVIARSSFEEARLLLKTEVFDVLLTDVRLGAFNGLQLAVLARHANPEIRIIVFSGFDDPVLHEEAEHVGATWVVKPVSSSHLLELIRGR